MDFDTGEIRVERQAERVKREGMRVVPRVKTPASKRRIHIPKATVELLAARKARQQADGLPNPHNLVFPLPTGNIREGNLFEKRIHIPKATVELLAARKARQQADGLPNPHNLVFPLPTGNIREGNLFEKHLRKNRAALGYPELVLTSHSFRKTCASILEAQGAPTGNIREGNLFEKHLRKNRAALGYPELVLTSHSFRKTCASILEAQGASTLAIRDYLGHEDAVLTEKVYIARNLHTVQTAKTLDAWGGLGDL